jgi:DNA-binding response OmpR family regulator
MSVKDTILIVDDQPSIRICMKQLLDRAGYQVLTANDGDEALALLQSQPVDLIIADIIMPHMDGYQLHERVIENPAWVAIPFVFLTACRLDVDIRRGKASGADGYLVKPVGGEDLISTVRGRLRRARQLTDTLAESAPPLRKEATVLTAGRLRIEVDQYRAWLDERPLELSTSEFRLLQCLAQRVNKVVSLEDLVQSTHGLECDHDEASSLLRPMVRSLRRKMGYQAGNIGCIQSVRGVGYRLVPSVDSPPDPTRRLPGKQIAWS